MSNKQKSSKPMVHKQNICKLKKDGNLEEIAKLSAKPIVFCNKCKAQADNPSSLCNPRAIKQKKAA
jgi:hypothetical protein